MSGGYYTIAAETRSYVTTRRVYTTVHGGDGGSSSHIFLVFFVVRVKVDDDAAAAAHTAAGSADRLDRLRCSVRTRPGALHFRHPTVRYYTTVIDARHMYRSDYCVGLVHWTGSQVNFAQ